MFVIKGMPLLPMLVLVGLLRQGPLVSFPAKYHPTAPAPGEVVAQVNGVDIKASDIEPLLWEWRGLDAIQDVVTYQLVKQEADKLRIVVPDAQIEAKIDQGFKQMATSGNLPAGKSPEVALLEQGFTRSRLFLRYETEALLKAMVERNFMPKNFVKVSTIVFRTTEQVASLSQAIQRANEAYATLGKGGSWEKALADSGAPLSAQKVKGMIGWRDMGAFPASVRDEMATLKVGQITKPAQTPNGIQIFRIEVKGVDAKGADLDELKSVYAQSAQAQLLEKLHKEAKVVHMYPKIPGIDGPKDGN